MSKWKSFAEENIWTPLFQSRLLPPHLLLPRATHPLKGNTEQRSQLLAALGATTILSLFLESYCKCVSKQEFVCVCL